MIIDLQETKAWLRVDGTDEDGTIQTLIAAAETYLHNATEIKFDSSNPQAKLLCLVLVADWFENRQLGGEPSDKVRFTVKSILAQLQYSYKPPSAPTGLVATGGNGIVDLSWTANAEENIAGYYVYQGGAKITTSLVTATSYQVTGLTNGTAYSFQVSAVDSAGNESALSLPVTVILTI